MRIKSIIIVLALSFYFNGLKAQQIFEISEYLQHNFLYNPAASGASDYSSVGATYKKMWSGIAGGPQTFIGFFDTYFPKKKTGLSVAIYSDKTGPITQTGGQVNLSYSIEMENNKRLMFGLGGQVLQYQLDKGAISSSLEPTDPLLAASGTEIKGDAQAGIYYKSPTFNVGVSAQQLIQSQLYYLKGTTNDLEGKLYRHYYLVADYNWRTDPDDVIIPNVLVQYLPNAPTDFQVGARLEHKDFLWVGAGYDYHQSYSLYAGVKIDHQLAIGYAFEQYNSPVSSFDNGGGSNEIYLRYYFIK